MSETEIVLKILLYNLQIRPSFVTMCSRCRRRLRCNVFRTERIYSLVAPSDGSEDNFPSRGILILNAGNTNKNATNKLVIPKQKININLLVPETYQRIIYYRMNMYCTFFY